ncbi:MAG: hypothetical protein IPP83_12630 [Flavobacteriales bacterium]|nr:hypothetical protein [Flavobacteriales bacterium]
MEHLRTTGASNSLPVRYSQNLVAANNDRDVVNLFYGFLSSPEELPRNITQRDGSTREVKDPLQRANHYVAGSNTTCRAS